MCVCVCVCVCAVIQSCLTLCDPMDCSPSRLLCPWNSPGKNTGLGYHSLLQGNLPKPRIKPGSPALQASLPFEPPGKESVLTGGSVKTQMTGSKTQSQIQDVSGGAPEFACLTSSVV